MSGYDIIGDVHGCGEKIDTLKALAHEGLGDSADVSDTEFIAPLLESVGGLPPAEVAMMAESLVGLQVLRLFTQADLETVLKPFDEGTSHRQSGFQWIRHKSLTLP
jgi:hypothetical protein